MNPTIARITFRAMLGRRRALLLLVLPLLLLVLAVVLRLTDNSDLATSESVLSGFALAALLPLLCLIVGTGVIGPEIDDGQIMYILSKPIARQVIIMTKLVVALTLLVIFAVVPTLLAGLIMTGTTARMSIAFTIGTLVGGTAYCALFVALAVASRHAVTLGLLYALVWESLIGNFAPGARSLSIQQWSLSVTDLLTSASAVKSEVAPALAVSLLIAVTALGAILATARLRTLSSAGAE